jgi:hypothetical protein
MALKKTIVTVQGITVDDAYNRVEAVQLSTKSEMQFVVRAYKNLEKPFFSEKSYSCVYDLNGENPIAQAYKHIKAIPEYANAYDC